VGKQPEVSLSNNPLIRITLLGIMSQLRVWPFPFSMIRIDRQATGLDALVLEKHDEIMSIEHALARTLETGRI
jgi:hypothetical protein